MKSLKIKIAISLFLCVVLFAFKTPKKKINIWMIGDSTMSQKEAKAYPETGWGMAFSSFFNNGIIIKNKAVNGRSTKSFLLENRWQPIFDSIQKGDYVFIEFGHNDEKIEKPTVGTSIQEFKNNLVKYVLETRIKKGIPILMTPISRRSFKNGELKDTHGEYPAAVISVADSLHVYLIDMLAKSKNLLINLGDENSKPLFNYVDSGNINYPQGKKDDTHFSPIGANKMAALAVEGIKELKLKLVKSLVSK